MRFLYSTLHTDQRATLTPEDAVTPDQLFLKLIRGGKYEMNGVELERLNSVNIGVSIEESQQFYKTWAGSYNKDSAVLGYSGPARVAQKVAELFSADVRGKVNILDVGAGTGLVAIELRKLGFTNLDALEPNESMLLEAKKGDLYDNYFMEFLTELPSSLSADKYDVITGSGIYGDSAHVPCEALYEMIRLVKPGGYVVLATRNEFVQQNETYKHLEPLMDKLETDRKWTKVSRDVFPKFYLKKDGVIWCYRILEK